jgi:hypothetical protein
MVCSLLSAQTWFVPRTAPTTDGAVPSLAVRHGSVAVAFSRQVFACLQRGLLMRARGVAVADPETA